MIVMHEKTEFGPKGAFDVKEIVMVDLLMILIILRGRDEGVLLNVRIWTAETGETDVRSMTDWDSRRGKGKGVSEGQYMIDLDKGPMHNVK